METCKLCVSIPGKSLKIDMPRPDAEVWFTTLVDALLNTPEPDQEPDEDTEEESEYEDDEDLVEEDDSEEAEGPEDAQDTAPPKKSVIDVKETRSRPERAQDDQDEREGYKGFLRIRCTRCDKMKSFCTKKRLTGYYCECGGYTDLDDLVEINARCSVCGHTWGYRTNNTDPLDEITCLSCGAPITLERDKRGNYRTIGRE